MRNYPIFYQIQNGEDNSQNVFSLNFNEEKDGADLRLRHILSQFPIDLTADDYHIRFKIECNEIDPKLFAWVDPSNLNAKAPLINNTVHMKLLKLNREGDSKIFTREKIRKARTAPAQQPQQQPQQTPAARPTNQPTETNKYKSESEATIPKAQQPPKATSNPVVIPEKQVPKVVQQVQKKIIDIWDDEGDNSTTVKKQEEKPAFDLMNMDEQGRQPKQMAQQQQPVSQPAFANAFAESVHAANLIDHHVKAPESEFDIEVRKRESEYTFNGVIDRETLKKVKADVLRIQQEKEIEMRRQRERDEAAMKDSLEDIKAKQGPIIKEWAEQNGTRRDIRSLLSTIHNVLWKGVNWNPVTFSDLASDENLKELVKKAKVRFHPDKNRGNPENRFICEQVIDVINQAFKDYQSKSK